MPLIDQSQTGCQSPHPRDTADKQQLSVSIKASALCVLIGNNSTLGTVIKMPIYKKVVQAVVKLVWSRRYGFVDAVLPSGVQHQTDAAEQERLRRPAWAFVSTWELSPHSTWIDKAALLHVERYEKKKHIIHHHNVLCQSTDKYSADTLGPDHTTPHTAPPCNCLLQEQSFYKKGLRLRSSLVRPSPLALSSLGYLTAPKDILPLDFVSTQAPFVRK